MSCEAGLEKALLSSWFLLEHSLRALGYHVRDLTILRPPDREKERERERKGERERDRKREREREREGEVMPGEPQLL